MSCCASSEVWFYCEHGIEVECLVPIALNILFSRNRTEKCMRELDDIEGHGRLSRHSWTRKVGGC